MVNSFEEKALPLANARKIRAEKHRASLGTDDYVITVTNPRRRPLAKLLGENGYPSPEGDDVASLLESFGYEVEIILDHEDPEDNE